MVEVREMRIEDIQQVLSIEQEAFSQPWSAKAFEESLLRKDTFFYVAAENQEILGYVGMYQSFEEGEITNIAVFSKARRKGIGRQMLEHLKENAKRAGIEIIFLEVRVSNEPAICLYERCGFEKCGVRKGFYDFPREDAYVMSNKMKEHDDFEG